MQSCLLPLTGVSGPSVTHSIPHTNAVLFFLVTYHRITGYLRSDRNFWKSSGPNPQLKQGHFRRTTFRWLLKTFKNGDYTASVGNLCQRLVTLTMFLPLILG